ncbi:MAG TPA: glycosyltransferase, partial [Polyangiaceae bacterium]|jgi:glycosyltransferase involved in cell wall biosynthesis|nr:glycosyltransferase [Polyangiaceae bacterium]
MSTPVLFVTWDGPDSPYLETLFLPVFRELTRSGFSFRVLQFTWASEEHVQRQARAAEAMGVGYTSFPVFRGPAAPSALAMIAAGAVAVGWHAKRHRAKVILPRSILPAAMALGARSIAKCALSFDADGLPADERVEFGGWSTSGATYRVWRQIEARGVRAADSVITRTEAAKEILLERAGRSVLADKIFVIPNARDPQSFSPGTEASRAAARASWGATRDEPCLLYAGSIGPQYFPDEMLSLFERVRAKRRDARFVVLTRNIEALRSALRRVVVDESRVVVRAVEASDVASHIAAADTGLALRALTFSQRAVSPVKVSEYLLCGLPVVATPVGDLEQQVDAGAGLFVAEPSPENLDRAASWFVNDVIPNRDAMRTQSRESGLRHFSLDTAAERTRAALEFACVRAEGR